MDISSQKDKRFYGNYLGIVIQNNDPDKSGRVKVFVPHISPNSFNNWIADPKDKYFSFLGTNVKSELNLILDDLKLTLPWAELALPITGECSSGRYHATLKQGSISDSNYLPTTTPLSSFTTSAYSQNLDGFGEKPANIFEKAETILQDAFFSPAANYTQKHNVYSSNYKPNSYSNSTKGTFTIPSVGSHVWVFFHDGEPQKPVVFATSYGQADWASIYQDDSGVASQYPGAYENVDANNTATTVDPTDVATFRHKHVINTKGGTLEFNSTDNQESVKVTHYSGSFIDMNNQTMITLATKNEQKLVLGDSFETFKGHGNQYTQRDFDFNVRGDHYITIGDQNPLVMSQLKSIYDSIADTKQLFEVQRTSGMSSNNLLKKTSTQQQQSGSPAQCPVCAQQYPALNNNFISVPTNIVNNSTDGIYNFTSVNPFGMLLPVQPTSILQASCPSCGGQGTSQSSQSGNWNTESKKDNIKTILSNNSQQITKLEQQLGLGGSQIITIAKHKTETIGILANDLPSIRVDPNGKINNSNVVISREAVFPNQTPTPLLEPVHVDQLPGGVYSLNVSDRYNLLVGSGGISIKTSGQLNMTGTLTNITGEQVNISSVNEVNINCSNRLSLLSNILTLKATSGQVLINDSNLGVTDNLIVNGGAMIEGELFVEHISAPVSIRRTLDTILCGWTDPGVIVGYVGGNPDQPVYGSGHNNGQTNPNSVINYPHSHFHYAIPTKYYIGNADLRSAAMACNGTSPVPALPQDNGNDQIFGSGIENTSGDAFSSAGSGAF